MNKLKFGHSVVAWSFNKSNPDKGKYIKQFNDGSHLILSDNDELEDYRHCKLDPNATEFVSGDEVEVKRFGKWVKAMYHGYAPNCGSYVCRIKTLDGYDRYKSYRECRYPKPSYKDKPLSEWTKQDFHDAHDNGDITLKFGVKQ